MIAVTTNDVTSSRKTDVTSTTCLLEIVEIATTSIYFGASSVMVAESKKVTSTDLVIPKQKRTETALDATPVTKKVCLGLADPSKTVVIGDNLGEK
jgi:hypothetical protein